MEPVSLPKGSTSNSTKRTPSCCTCTGAVPARTFLSALWRISAWMETKFSELRKSTRTPRKRRSSPPNGNAVRCGCFRRASTSSNVPTIRNTWCRGRPARPSYGPDFSKFPSWTWEPTTTPCKSACITMASSSPLQKTKTTTCCLYSNPTTNPKTRLFR